MKILAAAAATVLTLALSGCGGDSDIVDSDDTQSSSESETKADEKVPAKDQGAIVKSGFGQGDSQYVGLAAIVKNSSDHAGQTVTVSFNLKDEAGQVLKTESQVDSFAWPGQELAVVTQADVGEGKTVASVEATLLIEDDGTFSDSVSDDLGSAEAKLETSEYGEVVAKVEMTNPLDEILKDPGVKVVCEDAAGTIAGGGYTYPELIAAGGQYADSVSVLVAPSAKTCTSYLVPGVL